MHLGSMLTQDQLTKMPTSEKQSDKSASIVELIDETYSHRGVTHPRTFIIVSKDHRQHSSQLGPYNAYLRSQGYTWPDYRVEKTGPDGHQNVFIDREYWDAQAVKAEVGRWQDEHQRCFV